MTASPPAAPGMPSEEEIKALLLQFHADTASAWRHERDGIAVFAARAILSLIRPAFEAKDAEIERQNKLWEDAEERCGALIDAGKAEWTKHGATEIALGQWKARALSAEAKLAQAVEALEPFAKAADLWENNTDDADAWVRPLHLAERIKARLTVGALRRARSAAARGET